MSFGLKTLNDDGINLIDETFKSMCVVASGSASTTDPGTPVRKDLSLAGGVNPMLAVDSHGIEFGIIEQGFSGGTFFWSVARADGSSTAMPFDYWIFDNVPATAPSGMGLLVRNASNQIVFNSQNKYLRPETPAAGQDTAIIFCNGTIRIVSIDLGGSWSQDWHLNTAWIDGSNVLHTGDYLYRAGSPVGSDVSYVPNTKIMTVDVTNY